MYIFPEISPRILYTFTDWLKPNPYKYLLTYASVNMYNHCYRFWLCRNKLRFIWDLNLMSRLWFKQQVLQTVTSTKFKLQSKYNPTMISWKCNDWQVFKLVYEMFCRLAIKLRGWLLSSQKVSFWSIRTLICCFSNMKNSNFSTGKVIKP